MSDSVAKLYADLGFKVNQDGLKQFQSILKDFASQMNKLNSATKEAAKQYGIFSKDKAKQAMADEKLATQQARTEEVRVRTGLRQKNQAFKEEMAIRKADFNERIKEEREKDRIARAEQSREERRARNRKKILSEALAATGNFAKGIAKSVGIAGVQLSRLLYTGSVQSLNRSVATRDFMLMTGANLGDIQSVMSRFASIGHNVSQEQAMGDLIKLSQGIADIAMGSDPRAYKLLNTSIKRGDVAGMLKGIGMAGQSIDSDVFTSLLGDIGLPSYWLSFFKAKGGGKEITNFIDAEGQQKIVEAKSALGTLTQSFKNLSDWLVSSLSPVIIELSGSLQDLIQEYSEALQGEDGKQLSENIRALGKEFMKFVKSFDLTTILNVAKNLVGALTFLTEKIVWIARKFGYVPVEDREQHMKDYANRLKNKGLTTTMIEKSLVREAKRIGYDLSGPVYYDYRIMNSNVTVDSADVVDAVRKENENFGGIPASFAAVSGFGGSANGGGR